MTSYSGNRRNKFPFTGIYRDYKIVIPPGNSDSKENYPSHDVVAIDPANDDLNTTEYEDCSQLYGPNVVDAGDFWYMYYSANTQKYQTEPTAAEADRNNSDFSRCDRIFLSYKHKKDGGILEGEWTKWKEGRELIDGANTAVINGDFGAMSIYFNGTDYIVYSTKTDPS